MENLLHAAADGCARRRPDVPARACSGAPRSDGHGDPRGDAARARRRPRDAVRAWEEQAASGTPSGPCALDPQPYGSTEVAGGRRFGRWKRGRRWTSSTGPIARSSAG
jgi:hypothetical protein